VYGWPGAEGNLSSRIGDHVSGRFQVTVRVCRTIGFDRVAGSFATFPSSGSPHPTARIRGASDTGARGRGPSVDQTYFRKASGLKTAIGDDMAAYHSGWWTGCAPRTTPLVVGDLTFRLGEGVRFCTA